MLQTSGPIASPDGKDFGCVVLNTDGRDILDLNQKDIIRLFKRHGSILFRGFTVDSESVFSKFSDTFGKDFLTYPNERRERVSEDTTVQTAVKGQGGITLHQEMSYLPFPFCPEIVCFCCQQPPLVNGQTLQCDSTEVVPYVSKGARKLLESHRLRYDMQFTVDECLTFLRADSMKKLTDLLDQHSLNDIFTFTEDGVKTSYQTPAYTKTKYGRKKALLKPLNNHGRELGLPVFEDGSRLPDSLYDELEEIYDRLTVEIQWEKGDVLMFDNTRVMHGRRTVDDDQRLLYTRFGSTRF